MRLKGTLVDWKDDRGFGFIEPAEGGSRIFCHLKSFEVRVRRPMAGDKLTYEIGRDAQGRVNAVKVRPVGLEDAQYQSNIGSRRHSRVGQSLFIRNRVVSACLMAVIAFAGWSYFKNRQSKLMTTDDEQAEPAALMSKSESVEGEQVSEFQCDGRAYCSEMRSRAEAEFFVKHCPGTKMDGDHDGVPCENDSRF